MGSRHARKVKAESVLRQLQENGAEFRATLATGDIRCEVCEVSVNSSHQLQAHMTGRMIANCSTLLQIFYKVQPFMIYKLPQQFDLLVSIAKKLIGILFIQFL